MIALLLLLAACGFEGDLDQPSPPPAPPPTLSAQDADVIEHTGVVSDVAAATRSFTSTGDGRRVLCVLTANAVLEIDGHVAQITELPAGRTITIEGREVGDVVLVSRGTVAALLPVAEDTPPAPADSTAPTTATPPAATPPAATPPTPP